MARNWTELNSLLDWFMDDKERGGPGGEPRPRRFPVPLRITGWNWAQRALCSHTPRARSETLTIDTGKRTAILPPDLFAIDSIYDARKEKWWRPMRREPGDTRYLDDDLPEFWEWAGHLYMETQVEYDSADVILYYWAYYPDIRYRVNDDDEIDIIQEQIYTPDWAEAALCHLTTAFCWTPGAIMAADINEYKINVDAGNPLQNPRSQQAREHLFWWNVLLEAHPRPLVHRYAY